MNLDARDSVGATGLMMAAICGHEGVVKVLVKKKAKLDLQVRRQAGRRNLGIGSD